MGCKIHAVKLTPLTTSEDRMGRNWDHIEHPHAYESAIKASIYARANAKRRRLFAEAQPKLYEWLTWGDDYQSAAYVNGEYRPHPLGPAPSFGVKAVQEWGAPKDGAIAKLLEIMAEREQRKAQRAEQYAREAETAQAWTAGRQDVTGVVISVKEQPGYQVSRWAPATTVFKMLVKREDGSKIYLTAPRALDDAFFAAREAAGTNLRFVDWLRGKTVRFTVTVEPKELEPTFAFGKRPTGAEIVTVNPSQESK
jgi:hypothetical protein